MIHYILHIKFPNIFKYEILCSLPTYKINLLLSHSSLNSVSSVTVALSTI